jgi:hypothetical protein
LNLNNPIQKSKKRRKRRQTKRNADRRGERERRSRKKCNIRFKHAVLSIAVESIDGLATTVESIAYMKNVLKTTMNSTTMFLNAVRSE